MVRTKPKGSKSFSVMASVLLFGGLIWGGYVLLEPIFSKPAFQYASPIVQPVDPPKVIHLPTPEPLKAVYMTSWVAGTLSARNRLLKLLDETELNAVVIDIKDYTGRIAFSVTDPELMKTGAVEVRIRDLEALITDLHQRGIYVIGRVSVFQDAYFVKLHPEFAVHRLSDGEVWKDRKGISWLEVGATPVWNMWLKLPESLTAWALTRLISIIFAFLPMAICAILVISILIERLRLALKS